MFANCAAPASATVTVRNNQIRNIGTGTDGSDGIDFNIGDGANLTAVLENNVIENISDAGITFDIVSSATPVANPTADITIRGNRIRNIFNDDAIKLESNSAGQVVMNIENNVMQNIGTLNPHDGIDLEFRTNAASSTPARVRIVGNQLSNVSDRGIEIDTENNAQLQLEVSNNTIQTAGGEAVRLRAQNNSRLNTIVSNNTLTQGNPATRSLELRADNSSTLCANVFGNVQTSGSGFNLLRSSGATLRIVDFPGLSSNNGGVPIAAPPGVIDITIATFNAAPPSGCTFP